MTTFCGESAYINGVKKEYGGKNTHGEGGRGGRLRRWSACRLLLSKRVAKVSTEGRTLWYEIGHKKTHKGNRVI
jgi:hypothetical protein